MELFKDEAFLAAIVFADVKSRGSIGLAEMTCSSEFGSICGLFGVAEGLLP